MPALLPAPVLAAAAALVDLMVKVKITGKEEIQGHLLLAMTQIQLAGLVGQILAVVVEGLRKLHQQEELAVAVLLS